MHKPANTAHYIMSLICIEFKYAWNICVCERVNLYEQFHICASLTGLIRQPAYSSERLDEINKQINTILWENNQNISKYKRAQTFTSYFKIKTFNHLSN